MTAGRALLERHPAGGMRLVSGPFFHSWRLARAGGSEALRKLGAMANAGFGGSDCSFDGRSRSRLASSCPAHCSGNGACVGGACVCGPGFGARNHRRSS